MVQKFVVWVSEVNKEDIALVGGKGANLGEMTQAGLPVPPVFIVTSAAYFYFLKKNKLDFKIKDLLQTLDWKNPQRLQQVSSSIRKLILTAKIPEEIAREIVKYYQEIGESKGLKSLWFKSLRQPLVAVRSSATAEDLPGASFAGQQETYLNIKGEASLIEKVRQCWASLWLERAIFYRHEQKFDHFKVGIAVPVQIMVQSEKSGVMFTVDPLTSQKNKIVIEAIYGLGELIVQGAVTPDHYEIQKSDLKIISKQIGAQEMMMVKRGTETKSLRVSAFKSLKQKITDEEIEEIAALGKRLEKHYFFPQDVEWAIQNKRIYLVQTRPITTLKEMGSGKWETGEKKWEVGNGKRKPILTGIAASPGIGIGPVKIIKSARELNKISQGDVLVAEMTNPDYVPAMKKVVAVLTDRGGRTAHAAIVSRELGLPCVVGTAQATKILKNGDVITVDGGRGEVYRGGRVSSSQYLVSGKEKNLPNTKYQIPNTNLKTATKIYVNLAELERAEEVAKMNVDGVGLLRAEFMMVQIGTHPKKIIQDKKQEKFINQLAENLAVFCKAFGNRPVVYRATDFKTNEYRNLKGGEAYEPVEDNPLMGFRGTYRYIKNPEVFELELAAIKKVRNTFGYKNLWLMLPFVRTVEEFLGAKKIAAGMGLLRSPSFKIWLMVEIPANVILIDEFLNAGVDGVSIGSNDLSMLILGVDRDNAELSKNFNEKDPAVLWALERVVKACAKQKNLTCSLCGQAASDYPEIVEKLVKWGINSVSVNIDAVERTREIVAEAEKRLIKNVKD